MKVFKRIKIALMALVGLFVVTSCGGETPTSQLTVTQTNPPQTTVISTPTSTPTSVPTSDPTPLVDRNKYSISGFAAGHISDFSVYENTSVYRVVTTPEEFFQAINDAKYEYTNTYIEETNTVEQTLEKEGTVHVIEVANDLNLGYFKLSQEAKAFSFVKDYATNYSKYKDMGIYFSKMFEENGISQIGIERVSNLMVYSKNGAKITHAGFKLTSCNNVVFRNLSFDEIWQWEDSSVAQGINAIGDYDLFGWAYFKISHVGYIWIDHCEFGKSYDGQIDVANAVSNANKATAFRLAYGSDGNMGVSVTWCDFKGGSLDKDGYLYQMMQDLENDYQAGNKNALYYNALRDLGLSVNQILNGIAAPQKKGFLLGDQARYDENADEYSYNLKLKVSFGYCNFINFEDRIPKTRGGMIYLYNCNADSSLYQKVRTILLTKGISSKVGTQAGNATWKCAIVSQGFVCGQGGSIYAENSRFVGIASFIKNNDSGNSPELDGSYRIVNSYYECGDVKYTGSSSDPDNLFPVVTSKPITTEGFNWHNDTNTQPFTPYLYQLEEVESILNGEDGCGVITGKNLLNPNYN